MARHKAAELLVACGRLRPALVRSLGVVQHSGFSRELDNWKCCFTPRSYVGANTNRKTLNMAGIPLFQHRLFSSGIDTKRNTSFSTLNSDDILYFKDILDHKNVVQDEDRLVAANVDWMRKYKGSSQLLLLPKNSEDEEYLEIGFRILMKKVAKILKYCNSRCLAVVPQGGNTGLVGGSVPVYDEVIINLSAMDKIVSLDKVNGILICEAGCILENLNSYVENEGFVMPLDLGAKGSCQIGGNVATNAGGLHFIRYGSLHANILGLEVILADGTTLDMLTTLRKDNTGYDLKHLFIGSEGTLGIITKVALLTPCKPSSRSIAFLACNDYICCQKLLAEAKQSLGEAISAFEFMDYHSVEMVLAYTEGVRNPLPASPYNFYVLIETTTSDELYDRTKLEAFLLHAMEMGLVSDGVIAQDLNQASSFWRIREGIPEGLLKAGAVYKYDLSLPIQVLYAIVEEMRARLGNTAKVVGYGHLGDGNLHLNISTTHYDDKILSEIEPFVYEWTAKVRGSISAEHGLGLMKADKIHYSKSAETVQVMTSIKKLFDPKGIMNPYKLLPHRLFQD